MRNTQDIIKFYKNDPSVDCSKVVNIDYAIGDSSYTGAIKETFDYVVSAHVLEHMPRLIEFLQDICNVIVESGRVYAILPDCRFCFDHFRQPTSFAELYYIHATGIKNNPIACLDFFYSYASVNNPELFWNKSDCHSKYMNGSDAVAVMDIFERALRGEYFDAHFTTFTPYSFVMLIHDMIRAKLIPFSLFRVVPTEINDFSFGIVLEKNDLMIKNCPERDAELRKLRGWLDKLYANDAKHLNLSKDDLPLKVNDRKKILAECAFELRKKIKNRV